MTLHLKILIHTENKFKLVNIHSTKKLVSAIIKNKKKNNTPESENNKKM